MTIAGCMPAIDRDRAGLAALVVLAHDDRPCLPGDIITDATSGSCVCTR